MKRTPRPFRAQELGPQTETEVLGRTATEAARGPLKTPRQRPVPQISDRRHRPLKRYLDQSGVERVARRTGMHLVGMQRGPLV